MPFIHKLVAAGQEVIVYGKVKDSNGRLIIDHPEFEILREDDEPGESIHLERIVPIYRNIAGLAQRRLARNHAPAAAPVRSGDAGCPV